MLGVKNYTQDYIDECRAKVNAQLDAYHHLVASAQAGAADVQKINGAAEAFEGLFLNGLVLELDYLFVHRLRALENKDGNPLNEVRILCESLTENDGKLVASKTMKLNPAKSVLGYEVGDAIRLNTADFAKLAEAFFGEIENRYLLVEA